jgi:hypothetical protein
MAHRPALAGESEFAEVFDRLLKQTFRPRLDLQDAVREQLFSLVLETLERRPTFYGLIIERQPARDLPFAGVKKITKISRYL